MKKRLLLFAAALGITLGSNAQKSGDYLYTSDGRYQVVSDNNLIQNGDFSEGTTYWTTDGGNALNPDTFAVETATDGSKYLQVYQKSSGMFGTGSSLLRSFSVNAGQSYVISYQVKVTEFDGGNGAASVTLADGTKNYQDFLFSTTGNVQDATNQSLGSAFSYEAEWVTVNHAFTAPSEGYILLHFYAPFVNTCFTNFKVLEAVQVPDDRTAKKILDRLQTYINNPLFPNGHADLEDFMGGLQASVENNDMAEFNAFVESAEDAVTAFLDVNAPSVTRFLVDPGFETWGSGNSTVAAGKSCSWVGDKENGWILEGDRWTGLAASESDATMSSAHLRRQINGNYKLGAGGFKQTVKGMPAAKYLFRIKSRAMVFYNGNSYNVNYDADPVHDIKLFVNSDYTEMYPLGNKDASVFDAIGELQTDGNIELGFSMPGDIINQIEFDDAELRIIGWTEEQVISYFDNKALNDAKANLQEAIDEDEKLFSSNLYKYGFTDLRTAIDDAKATKEAATTEEEIEVAVTTLATAVSTFKKLNSQYTAIINTIDNAEAMLAEVSYTDDREVLQAAIKAAQDFVDSLTDQQSTETDQAILAQNNTLKAAINDFSFANAPGDEKYLFAKWVTEEENSFTLIPGAEVNTSSMTLMNVETNTFGSHSLNGRLAFLNDVAKLSAVQNVSRGGLTMNNPSTSGIFMAVLNLKKGDMVTIDFAIANTKHNVYVGSGNCKYQKADGTWVVLTEANKKQNTEGVTRLVLGSNKLGVGNKTRYNFIMTEDGTFDFGIGSKNATVTIGHIGITDAAHVTGIKEVKNPSTINSQQMYDLQGRRLSGKPASGLYIQDGKKYVVE